MVLSKVLKAKLSLTPNGVSILSTPGLDWLSGKPPPPHLRSTTRRGESSCLHKALLKGPSQCVCMCVLHGDSSALSQWGKVGLPLALWQESGPNFKGLPKVSEVTTNH